jgi:hypothetical protein
MTLSALRPHFTGSLSLSTEPPTNREYADALAAAADTTKWLRVPRPRGVDGDGCRPTPWRVVVSITQSFARGDRKICSANRSTPCRAPSSPRSPRVRRSRLERELPCATRRPDRHSDPDTAGFPVHASALFERSGFIDPRRPTRRSYCSGLATGRQGLATEGKKLSQCGARRCPCRFPHKGETCW